MGGLRFTTAAVLGTAALLFVGGCSHLAGVDGALADDWAPPPAAQPWQPAASACYDTGFVDTPSLDDEPVECADQHLLETVYVGAFADRATPPADGSPERRAAYADCLAAAADFLGGDWRSGRLWLGIGTPSESAWSGGARWYRCDLWEYKDRDQPEDVPRTGTLKGALRGPNPLAYACYLATIKDDKVDTMVPVDCTKPHNAEFAGVYVAPDVTYPATGKERDDLAFNGCRPVVAAYVNVPNDGRFYHRTGLITSLYSAEEWAQGNRGIRCHLWLDRTATRSMKGVGTAGLPAG